MTRYVSYLRVSTQRQGVSGLGIEAQRVAVEQHIRAGGGTLIEEYVEVESGSVRNRPVLVKSIARCRQEKAVLVIAKLDRLARNVAFVSALMEAGVEFVAVDAPYANKLLVHILAAFAEHERLLISERTKAALAAAKSRGVLLGANGRKLADRHRAAAMEFAQTLREPILCARRSGAETLQDIADRLNLDGLLTREGSTWAPAGVQRLMLRLELRTPAMATSENPRRAGCSAF